MAFPVCPADGIGRGLGQPMVVENMPGASGIVCYTPNGCLSRGGVEAPLFDMGKRKGIN